MLGNLALSEDAEMHAHLLGEGTLELLVLLAAYARLPLEPRTGRSPPTPAAHAVGLCRRSSWDDAVQQEAAIAIANFALQPQNRAAVVQAGALGPLLEQLSSPSAAVNYHAAQALMAIQ